MAAGAVQQNGEHPSGQDREFDPRQHKPSLWQRMLGGLGMGPEPKELTEKKIRTEGLWVKCEGCRQIVWKKDLEDNLNVCPKCDKHFRVDARMRLAQLLDGDYETFDMSLASTDPLKFTDLKPYAGRLKKAQKDTELKDEIRTRVHEPRRL